MAGTSGTESCEGRLYIQFKHLPPQLALKLSLVRLAGMCHCLRKIHIRLCFDNQKSGIPLFSV